MTDEIVQIPRGEEVSISSYGAYKLDASGRRVPVDISGRGQGGVFGSTAEPETIAHRLVKLEERVRQLEERQ